MFKEFCDICETEDGSDYRDFDDGCLCQECYNDLDEEDKKTWGKVK